MANNTAPALTPAQLAAALVALTPAQLHEVQVAASTIVQAANVAEKAAREVRDLRRPALRV